MTDAGALDVLGTIHGQRGYNELLPHSSVLQIQVGLKVRLLNLETLIETKEAAGRGLLIGRAM